MYCIVLYCIRLEGELWGLGRDDNGGLEGKVGLRGALYWRGVLSISPLAANRKTVEIIKKLRRSQNGAEIEIYGIGCV